MMAEPDEPLRENEVGPFGELARRPNPDNLVILSVPAIEDLLPSLQEQLGRELTPQEIDIQRRKAPSIVVNKIVADKMRAERAGRQAAIQPETTLRPPTVANGYKDIPSEQVARMEASVDVFGQHLFFLRNQLVERLRRVIESAELRKRLGSLHRKEYDAVAALAPAERDAALSLARKTIDLYMQDILRLFAGTGDSLRFGCDHAINYRLVLQVKEVETGEVVEEFDINRKCKRVLYEYYGRWLNRFGNHR